MAAAPKFAGQSATRIDGPAKVTGAARYPDDEPMANAAYAWLLVSTIGRGRIRNMDLSEAKAMPGVIDIMTHENVGGDFKPPAGPDQKGTTTTLESDRIWHDGQIIAVVTAESFDDAREAAYRIKVDYEPEAPSATFGSSGVEVKPKDQGDPEKGDAETAFAVAAHRIDAEYDTPTQHHNPIELFTTTCIWDGPNLTIYEPTQGIYGLRAEVAKQLQMSPDQVRVVSRYVGGGFGSKGAPTARTALVALAARRVGRPVKLTPTRAQGFTIVTYRAETRQRLRLGAGPDGMLISLIHEGFEVTSRPSDYSVSGVDTTARMYACPNIKTAVSVVHADRNTPGFMRAPPDTPYMFALESAMDELAFQLKMDPIELRRLNDTQSDPVDGKPFSSRSLMKCFDAAAEKFGWSRRSSEPGSMTDGDWLVGWGCATSCYPTNIGPAAARVSLSAEGKATVEMAGQEIGNGAYTVAAITVADALGLGVEDVKVSLGDSNFPPMPVAGGSNNTASMTNALVKVCEDLRRRLAEAAAQSNSVFAGADPRELTLSGGALVAPDGKSEPLRDAVNRAGGGVVEALGGNIPKGLPDDALANLYRGKTTMLRGSKRKDVTAYAFGAHFVEVRVHKRTCELRTPRIVSAFASGTIVNPLTAYSQYMGGAIWGVSSALFEATEIDGRRAAYMNKNLADYRVPVNADVEEVDVIFIPEEDSRANPLGVKGIGEIGIVGMNAAVANAVFHATGKRLRSLPIRIEDLI